MIKVWFSTNTTVISNVGHFPLCFPSAHRGRRNWYILFNCYFPTFSPPLLSIPYVFWKEAQAIHLHVPSPTFSNYLWKFRILSTFLDHFRISVLLSTLSIAVNLNSCIQTFQHSDLTILTRINIIP